MRVEAGAIVYREAVLIRPPRASNAFAHVHGLTWDRLKGERPFREVWPKLAPILDGCRWLVAHNAAFDRSVLKACCAAADLPVPSAPWVCTVELAKGWWPKPHSNKLPDVCGRLAIPLPNHHDALADAEACARVYLALKGVGRADGGAAAAGAGGPGVAAGRGPGGGRQAGPVLGGGGAVVGAGPAGGEGHAPRRVPGHDPDVAAAIGPALYDRLRAEHAEAVAAVGAWRCQRCGRPTGSRFLTRTCPGCIQAEEG